MAKKESEAKLGLTMWCFLGKFAKRKSLKPDLFRRAVGKAQEPPRKSRGLSPIKSSVTSVRIEVESIENRESTEDRGESPSRSAFEIIEEDSSRSAFESEVREDVLQARDGPSEDDVKEAWASMSPVPADESGNDGEWEDFKEDGDSVFEDAAVRDKSREHMSEADHDTEQEPAITNNGEHKGMDQGNKTTLIHQDAVMVQLPANEASCAGEDRIEEQSAQTESVEEDALAYDDLQPQPTSPSEGNTNTEEAATTVAKVLSDIATPSLPDNTAERNEDIQFPHSPQTGFPAQVIENVSGSAAENSIVEPDIAEPEKQQDQVMDLESQDQTNNTGAVTHENLDIDNTTEQASESTLPLHADIAEITESLEQTESELSLHDAVQLKDDFGTLLVDSVPDLQLDKLSASTQKQSPRPVVKLPICTTDAKAQEGRVETGHVVDPQDAAAELPTRLTRSGARFSDDTNLLKDFLNRAQARKLAKDSKIPAQGPSGTSPRRSPRKALAEMNSNSPSPQKPKDLATRPGTPPGKQRLDAFSFDDVDELTAEPTSCRRSNRTRPPTASKASAGAPSFIPVRRADGTDPVILQKSIAQDLAVQTRANTRRNKGQSKPPKLALQTLTAETTEVAANRERARANCRSVSWDEKLVYYQGIMEAAAEEEGKEEKRPKIRRLRGLGASNGTPAPKRVVDNSLAQGPPAPRRRGKIS